MDSTTNLDIIEKVLQTTGLSCDDLLVKLQEYKAKQVNKATEGNLSEATQVLEEQPSVDQQCTLADENPVIPEAKSFNSSHNASEEKVNLEVSSNTNYTDSVGNKTADKINEHLCNSENDISYKNSNDGPTVTAINGAVEVATEGQISKNLTSSDNNIDNVPTAEIIEKEIPRRSLECFEDFSFCQEKSDDIADSIKGEVEDILKKLALQDSESKLEDASTSSIANEEDCFDSTSFHHSDDSASCQKDVFQSKEETSDNNTAMNENAAENVPNCPSIEDHNYSHPKNNCPIEENLSTPNTDDASKTEEDLRNIIRMQLSSLRNMKKSSTYLPDLQKRRSVFFHNLKKKRKSCDINPTRPLSPNSNESDCKEAENTVDDITEADANDDSLVSLSDETGFVIMDVTGGVDRVTEENTSSTPMKNEERKFAAVTETNIKPKRRYGFIAPMNQDKKLLTIKNYSGTFSEDPGINKSVKNSEKSPFVSDSLEDFLNESSQLKISYSIPKLGAEDGIGESTKKSPFDGVVGKTSRIEQEPPPVKEKPKLIKAKTLAEMRRQMEKLKSNKKLHYPLQVKKVEPIKEEESEDNSKALILKEYNINVVPPHRNSYVVYNKKKMWVSTSSRSNCVAVIDSPGKVNREFIGEKTAISSEIPKVASVVNRKLSLLSTLNQKKQCRIKYKPGPLCKKVELQNLESRDKWATELKTLPKVYLEVVPEVNKPIDPNLVHLLPVFDDCVITEERANFALTALKPKSGKVETQTFNFHVPYYNNQEKMLVRKRCEPIIHKPDLSSTSSANEIDPTTDIANIIDDIVRYIEVKEIEDSLIKEDDVAIKEEPQTIDTSPKTKPRKHKRKKLDLELARLSCKVIDVKTETTEDKECTKPYCKMGCICKSLLCDSVFSDHCQLVECMFGCKCPPTESSASNNTLSAHTVTHLEDKAKKNLAKVEREFTQTLIHTDNDVILVGARGRNRGRATKVPKKFTDFVGNLDEIMIDDPQDEHYEKLKLNLKNCTVDVPKLNLENIIPYCLYHQVYDCDCKGEMIDFPTPAAKIPKIRITKTKEDVHKSWYNSCARIRKVFSQYKERNKDPKYTEKLRLQLHSDPDIQDEFSSSCITSSNYRETASSKPSKRKQSFNIREDVIIKSSPNNVRSYKKNVEKEFALQRRKKKAKPNVNFNEGIASKYYPIFDGEIRVNLKDNQDMLKIIGEEGASLEYLRILPWTKVIESFNSRKMNIWAKEKRSSALLCNAAGYFPPKYFVDIRKVHHRSDIINWIISDSLPPDRPRELMHLILTPRKNYFVISGYCLKKVEINDKPAEQPSDACAEDGTFVSNLAPACVKLEPTDPDDISNSDEYSENLAILERVTETCEPVEDTENIHSLHLFQDVPAQHKPLKEDKDLENETDVTQIKIVPTCEPIQNESNINIKLTPVTSSLNIRPVSLSDLLEPKLKQMQASRASMSRLQSSPKEIKSRQTPPISISDLLASTSVKRTAPSPPIRIKKTISLSELLSASGASKLDVEDISRIKKIESDVCSESETTPSQPQFVKPSGLNNLECKTEKQSTRCSEEAELLSLLDSSNSKARIVPDLDFESVGKPQLTQSIPSEPVISKNNEHSIAPLVTTTIRQSTSKSGVNRTSPTILKSSEHGIRRPQAIAVLQPSQPGQNITIIQGISVSGLFESKANATQIKAFSVLKSPESRMKQIQAAVSKSKPAETNSSAEFTEGEELQSLLDSKLMSAHSVLKSHHSESDFGAKENSPKENGSQVNLENKINSAKENSLKEDGSQINLENKISSAKENVIESASELQLEDATNTKENANQEPQQLDNDININENSSSNLPESVSNDKQLPLCSSPELDAAEPLDTASCSSFEDTEEIPEAEPEDSSEVAAASESLTTSQTSEPEANEENLPSANTESNSSNVQETENVTTKTNETEDKQPVAPKRSTNLRMSRATAIRESKRTSTGKPKTTQPKTNAKQTVRQSTTQPRGIPSRSLKCTHKDMYNKNKTLVLTNKVYGKRRLYFVDQETEINGALTIPLPKVAKTFKWRMIYLNSDFSFLSFARANYSIKYTDLMDVVQMSTNIKSTITLKNKEFTDHYKHPLFGIWCVPDYRDRLFIGPYLPFEKHNIETLRYLHRKLIDTQIFNKMVGKRGDEKSPTWLYETLPKTYMPTSSVVIDITEDDRVKIFDPNDDVCVIDDDSEPEENEEDFIVETLLCPPFVEKLTQEELKAKKINRYIMTNIPHLGYFGACQRDSKAIEVFWPDNVRGYRFPNVTFAKNLLILYLSQIFCPIPKDFRINVVIMTHLDLESNKPVESKYFTQTGPYVCGEFGIYEKDDVPNELLERHGITSIDSLLNSEDRSEDNDNKLVKLFGLFLMSNEELRKHPEAKDILQWASSETYILKKLGENYDSEKGDLRNIIRTNKLKIQQIKPTNKPPSKPVVTVGKRKNTGTLKVTETIEIDDSDEDAQLKKATDDNEPAFKKICTSGKIQTGESRSKNEGRSLLRPQFTISGRSLLKVTDVNKKKIDLISNDSSNASTNSIEISVNNSNIVVNRSNLVITKMNQKPQTSE